MKRLISVMATWGLVFMLTGCRTRSTIVLVPDPAGSVGQLVVANEGGQRVLSEANQSVQVSGLHSAPGGVKSLETAEIRAVFATVLDVEPPPPVIYLLYFLEGSNELTEESKTLLPQIMQAIQSRNSTDIVISGHTDTVGEPEYNYRLSLERARAAFELLVARGAVAANITVTSHGEGNPLIKTADGVEEPRNRRVEVVIK